MAAKEMPKAVANCFIALSTGTFRGCLHHGDGNRAGGARQGRKLRRGSWGNRRPCAGHARRAAPYVSFVAISRSRRPANPCGVKIAWLENQTGVNYLTIRRHYGKWMPTEGES